MSKRVFQYGLFTVSIVRLRLQEGTCRVYTMEYFNRVVEVLRRNIGVGGVSDYPFDSEFVPSNVYPRSRRTRTCGTQVLGTRR